MKALAKICCARGIGTERPLEAEHGVSVLAADEE